MEVMDIESVHVDDCKAGWLMVEKDFTCRLFKQEQLKYALQCMGRNPSDKTVSRYWTQCGGSMSYEQFSLVMKRERKTTISDLMNSFRKMDSNGHGYIDSHELKKVLTKRGENMSLDEIQTIIDEADSNGDGKFDYAEFCHMLLNSSEECISAAKQKAANMMSSKARSADSKSRWKDQAKKQTDSASQRDHTTRNSNFDRQKFVPSERQQRSGYSNQRDKIVVESGNKERVLTAAENSDSLPLLKQNSSSQMSSEKVKSSSQLELMQVSSISTESAPNTQVNESSVNLVSIPVTSACYHGNGIPNGNMDLPKTHPLATSKQNEHNSVDSHVHDKPVVGSQSLSSTDMPELASNSATRLPPLKKTSLPLLPPILGGPTLPPNHNQTQSDATTERTSLQSKLAVEGQAETATNSVGNDDKARNTDSSQYLPKELTQGDQENEEADEIKTVLEDGDRKKVQSDSGIGYKNPDMHADPSTSGDVPSQENNFRQDSVDYSAGSKKGARDNSPPIQEDRQTDHLNKESADDMRQSENGKKKIVKASTPTSVFTPPPKKPKNIKSWNSITGKGCFYLDPDEVTPGSLNEDGVIRCHHYRLKLPSPTNVWVEMGVAKPGILATDVLLFVFHTDENEEPTELITYTQHKVNERWISRLDLDAGTYALIPYTTRCYLKPREDEIKADVPLVIEDGGYTSLSEQCCRTLNEVFHRMDLDGNGFISRTEFDFFQERTSGEICDDEAWKVIQDNFELNNNDELTLKGFLDLHLMTAEDDEGGEDEVRDILNSLGYNSHLELDQACPFVFDLYTEDNEGEIEIVDLLPFDPVVGPALSYFVKERGVFKAVLEGKGELDLFTFTTPCLTTLVVENKSLKNASVQLDCSASVNCVFSHESALHVMSTLGQSLTIGFQIQPLDPLKEHAVDCTASKILC